jgi:MFS family permease
MNLVYAASAFPFGKLSDRINHKALLALGMLVLAQDDHGVSVLLGVGLIWDLCVARSCFTWGRCSRP